MRTREVNYLAIVIVALFLDLSSDNEGVVGLL